MTRRLESLRGIGRVLSSPLLLFVFDAEIAIPANDHIKNKATGTRIAAIFMNPPESVLSVAESASSNSKIEYEFLSHQS